MKRYTATNHHPPSTGERISTSFSRSVHSRRWYQSEPNFLAPGVGPKHQLSTKSTRLTAQHRSRLFVHSSIFFRAGIKAFFTNFILWVVHETFQAIMKCIVYVHKQTRTNKIDDAGWCVSMHFKARPYHREDSPAMGTFALETASDPQVP